jgi:ribosomal protein S27AE
MTSDESPCPHCGEPVPVTVSTPERGDQLAAPDTECPNCGASLVRAVEGHADRGWRLARDANGGESAA